MDETAASPAEGAPQTGAQSTNSPAQPALVLLPRFMMRLNDGLYVALSLFESRTAFHDFVDGVFTSNHYFSDLDYGCLQKLLYDCEPAEIVHITENLQQAGKRTMWRLAKEILPFPSERQQWYRNAKVKDGGQVAEYLFEPIFFEKISEQSGKTVSVRADPNVDEFIAAMWNRYVRFGIDSAAVKKALAAGKPDAVIVARMRAATAGRDAHVQELVNSLHRDNTPKLLADGRVDLRQFQNRFPQVEKNSRLIKKIPREPGKSGWEISGNEIIPESPRDIDMALLAGAGIKVDRAADGEFLIATLSGFLQIDKATNTMSITEKIINREGVSLHTTGNLTLAGEEYEEHGEVEEHTQVEGKHMTFMANVFGNIISHGGNVVFKQNLSVGSAKSPGGTIAVEGSASQVTIEAIGGEITMHHAEGCLIMGKKVVITEAIHCDIVAEELIIELAKGCALAGQRVQVGSSMAWHDDETTISMLIPDLSAFDKELEQLKKKQAECEELAKCRSEKAEEVANQQEVKNFTLISTKLRAKEIVMTPEQEMNWAKMQARILPSLRQLKELGAEIRSIRGEAEQAEKKMQEIAHSCQQLSANIECKVDAIAGDTVVRTLKVRPDAPGLHTLPHRDLRARLRGSGVNTANLFAGGEGEFAWQFQSMEADDNNG
ncbi:MAG: DUF342 domain-containing protein [Burkholderiales bacterium]|nr:DUF342 domain-containing protein [Burkholderiales bacterium]